MRAGFIVFGLKHFQIPKPKKVQGKTYGHFAARTRPLRVFCFWYRYRSTISRYHYYSNASDTYIDANYECESYSNYSKEGYRQIP